MINSYNRLVAIKKVRIEGTEIVLMFKLISKVCFKVHHLRKPRVLSSVRKERSGLSTLGL